MSLSTTAKLAIGAVAALVVGGVALAASSPAPATPTPTPTPTNLHAGERYRIAITGSAPLPAPTVASFQAVLDALAPGGFHVVDVSSSGNAASYTVDALGSFAVQTPALTSGLPAQLGPYTVTITDLGPTPVSATGPATSTTPTTPTTPATTPTSATPGAVTPPPPASPGGVLTPPPAAPATSAQTTANQALLASANGRWYQVGAGVLGAPSGVSAGGRGRVTIDPTAVNIMAYQNAGGAGGARAALENFMATPALVALLGSALFVWAPGDALPPDWPPDDAHAQDGYHFEFVSLNASTSITGAAIASALQIASVTLWAPVALSGHPAIAPATGPSLLTWTAAATIQGGAHVRATVQAADVLTIANAVGVTQYQVPSCLSFIGLVQQTGFDQALTGGTPHVLVWCGADFLPPDWPPTDDLTQYHLEFRYPGGAGPLTVASLPFPVTGAWVAQGAGA